MKIVKKQIKKCTETSGEELVVLDLEYTHKGESGRVLIRDYDDSNYDKILKQVRKEVTKSYNNFQIQKAHDKSLATA